MLAPKTDPFQGRSSSYCEANTFFPDVRRQERAHLIDTIPFFVKDTVVDLQSASGFVAQGLAEQDLDLDIICVEPSPSLAATTRDHFRTICCPLEEIPLESNTVDKVCGLAAFHHCNSFQG